MILQRKKLAWVYWALETRRREKAFGAEISARCRNLGVTVGA